MELYELAVARRQMAPMIWMIFPERSEVLMHLAELSLWLGGSPLHEDSWLRLAYFSDFGKRLELNVLFEKDFSELLAEVLADNRRFEPEQFSWAGIPASKHSGAEQPSSILGIRRSSLKPNQAASTQSTS